MIYTEDMGTKKKKPFKITIAGKSITVGPNAIPSTKGGTPEEVIAIFHKLAKLKLFKIDDTHNDYDST